MDYYRTDSEFIERFNDFVFNEVICESSLPLEPSTRYLAILSALIGSQSMEAFSEMLDKALDDALDPIQIKEMLYQSTAYLGYGRMLPFLNIANKIMLKRGINLPLPEQATTTRQTRLEKGIDAQAEIFGEQMRESWKNGRINQWLAANCFGDYYTRNGLTLKQREMITFCFLAAQGGCEAQLAAHVKGNINIGNDKNFLLEVILQCLPYIGYPRSLNAIACINQAEK